MKIAIVCAVYKRPQLTKIVLEHYTELAQKYNLVLIAVGSEGEASRRVCEDAGWNYYEHSNQPLSDKMNRAFSEAKKFDVDGVVWIGSDDLISEGIIKYYFDNFDATTEKVMGLNSIYIYSIYHDKAKHFSYKWKKPRNETFGPARYHSKAIMDKVDWKPCGTIPKTRGVDSLASRYFLQLGIQEQYFTMEEAEGICVDIKGDIVMTSYLMCTDHNFIDADKSILHQYFPYSMPLIEELRAITTGTEELQLGKRI